MIFVNIHVRDTETGFSRTIEIGSNSNAFRDQALGMSEALKDLSLDLEIELNKGDS